MDTLSEQYVIERLLELQDQGYKDFHSKLMPTIPQDRVIGVRVPKLRKLAKEVYSSDKRDEFLNSLPHRYYEENNIHASLIMQIKDFSVAVSEVEKFLPYIDNWATCDMLTPKVFKTHKKELLPHVLRWVKSKHTYTCRFGIKMLMDHFLDDDFSVRYLKLVSKIKSQEYYVNMMCAWYFATALAKRSAETLPFIESFCLSKFTHNKAISKAVESYRVDEDLKEYLKTLRIK